MTAPPAASISMLTPVPQPLNVASSPAAQSFTKAVELINSGNHNDAYPLLVSVVTDDPSHAGAWWHLSGCLFANKNFSAAHQAMQRANLLHPNEPRLLTNLGWYAHVDEHTVEANAHLLRAVALAPELALGWTNLAQTQIALNDLDAALLSARRGVDLCSDANPIHSMALAFALLFKGHLQEGLKHYEARFRYKLPQFLTYAYPQWKGQPIDTLFLRAEQGIGDTISTLRFLPACAARVKRVLCYVNAELRTLVEDMAIPNVEVHALPAVLPSHANAWLPMMSLPMVLGLETSDIISSFAPPYIHIPGIAPPPDSSRPKRIGLVFAGSGDMDMDRWRSVPLREIFPLFSVPNTQWFSLQVGKPKDQIITEGAHGLVEDLSPVLTDMRETARIIASLDLVVTVDTSVAHLSAAMARPTYLIRNRRSSDWRWGMGNGTPSRWYPQTLIFERNYQESWRDVILRVKEAVNDFVKA